MYLRQQVRPLVQSFIDVDTNGNDALWHLRHDSFQELLGEVLNSRLPLHEHRSRGWDLHLERSMNRPERQCDLVLALFYKVFAVDEELVVQLSDRIFDDR